MKCTNVSEKNQKEENNAEHVSEISEIIGNTEERVPEKEEELRLVNPSEGCGNTNGYYYLAGDEQYDAAGNAYINIRYIDYQSRQDIVLCNKPDCKHDNENCTSYVNTRDALVLAGDNKLFLLCDIYTAVMFSMGGENSLMENEPTIYTMNLDGSDRQKAAVLESGTELQSSEYLIKGDKLYLVVSKAMLKEGDSTQMVNVSQELMELDTQKKSVRTVCDLQNQRIFGVWDQNIIIRKENYEKDPAEMTDSEYQVSWNSMKVNFYTLNLETGATEDAFETDYRSTENITVGDGKIYFGKYKDKVLNCYDLQTKETSILTEKLPAGSVADIVDGRIIYYCTDDAELNAEYTESYVIDTETGEVTEHNLFVNKPFIPVRILADAGEYYLVVSDCLYEEETTWAGTEQINILKYIRTLISKEDFWNCNPNYLSITEVGSGDDND